MPSATIELIDSETIGVRFTYSAEAVRQLRALASRRWNPKEKRWEVNLAHLADVMRIFALHPREAPPEAIARYRDRWVRGGIRIAVGPCSSRLSGSGIPLAALDEALSFPVHGHEYSRKFIQGSWDGRRRLLDRRDLRFPSGLLRVAEAVLKKAELRYEVECEPVVKSPATRLKVKGGELELRPYQKQAVREAIKAGRGVLEMATGSGKTLVAARILQRLKLSAFFFVHTKDLLHQARRQLGEYLGLEIGQVGDGRIDFRAVTVATIQTAIRAFGGEPEKIVDEEEADAGDATDPGEAKAELAERIRATPVVFFDECHHVPAETFYHLAMEAHSAAHRYGLSATPFRADRQDMLLEAAIGPKIYRANPSRLIEAGYLVPPQIRFVMAPYKPASRGRRDYRDVYRMHIVENDKRNALIASEASRLNKAGLSVLVLVNEVRHGEALNNLCKKSRFIQGADDASLRARALADLESKRLLTLIATTLADEGLDVPTLDAVILGGAGRSETKAFQRVGRALRPAKGKVRAEIIDFFDPAPYLIEHSQRRLALYRSEPKFEVDDRGIPA